MNFLICVRLRMERMEPGDAPTSMPTSSAATLDNSSTVLTKIASLYAERLMSDVILVVGGSEFPCHRLILCASSEVFQVSPQAACLLFFARKSW